MEVEPFGRLRVCLLTILLAIGLVPLAAPASAGGGTTVEAQIAMTFVAGQLVVFTPDGWTCQSYASVVSEYWTECTPDGPGTYRCVRVAVEMQAIGPPDTTASAASYCSSIESSVAAQCAVVNSGSIVDCFANDTGGAPPPFFCYAHVPSFIQAARIVCDLQAELF